MTDPASLPLRDIHLPAEAGWWPPAPGWWLLFALAALLPALVAYFHRRRRQRQRSAVSLARKELLALRARSARDCDAGACAQAVSGLLRRLCVSIFPRNETAGLTGAAWLAFLERVISEASPHGRDETKQILRDGGKALLEAPYRRHVEQRDVEALFSYCACCIDALARRQGLQPRSGSKGIRSLAGRFRSRQERPSSARVHGLARGESV